MPATSPYESGLRDFLAIHQESKESRPFGINPFPVPYDIATKDTYHAAFVLRLTFHIQHLLSALSADLQSADLISCILSNATKKSPMLAGQWALSFSRQGDMTVENDSSPDWRC